MTFTCLISHKEEPTCIMLFAVFAVECYECPPSETGCNNGPKQDNDTISICPVAVSGVGCWVWPTSSPVSTF